MDLMEGLKVLALMYSRCREVSTCLTEFLKCTDGIEISEGAEFMICFNKFRKCVNNKCSLYI